MRVSDWHERLDAVIAAHRAQPFAWGRTDCGTLAFAAVAAMTGVDPLAHVRRWHDEVSALRAIAAAGVASVEDFAALKLPEIPVSAARRGDLVMTDLPGQTRLASPAIVLNGEALTRAETGFIMVPAPRWRRAFGVGL